MKRLAAVGFATSLCIPAAALAQGVTASVIDLQTKAVTKTFGVGVDPQAVVWGGGGRAYVALDGEDRLVRVDMAAAVPTAGCSVVFPSGFGPSGLAVNAAGTRALVLGDFDYAALVDLMTMSELAQIPLPTDASGFALAASSAAFYPAGSKAIIVAESKLVRVDLTTDPPTVITVDMPVDAFGTPLEGLFAAINAAGTRAAVTIDTGGLQLVDLTTDPPSFLGAVLGPEGDPQGVAISPDGSRAIFVYESSPEPQAVVVALDTSPASVVAIVPVALSSPSAVAFTSTGDALIAGDDGVAIVKSPYTAVDTVITQPVGFSGTTKHGIAVEPGGTRAIRLNEDAPESFVTPNVGLVGGETVVTIHGVPADLVTSVTIGGALATELTVVSAFTLAAKTRAHAAGTVDVVLADTIGAELVRFTGAFTYAVDVPTDTPPATSCGVATNTPPVAQCRNVTATADATCRASASVDNGSFDPDAGDTITLTQTPAGPFALGGTSVMLTVTDSQGASSQCVGVVTVVDETMPPITCPAPQTVECTGSAAAQATVKATATDNCAVASVSCAAGIFPLGTTSVGCAATDTSGNTSTCQTSVTVRDTTAPTVTCPAPLTVECTSPSGATATCPASGTVFALGTTPVTCSATDPSGNTGRCGSSVKVVDTTPPKVSCTLVTRPRPSKDEDDEDDPEDDDGGRRHALFQVAATDACSRAVTLTIGAFPLTSGQVIRIDQTRKPGVRLTKDKRGRPQRFKVGPGQNAIKAIDASGLSASAVCVFPAPPAEHDDDHDRDRKDSGR
jgi:hypothetical protein